MINIRLFLVLLISFFFVQCATTAQRSNTLNLLEGNTLQGWKTINKDTLPRRKLGA